MKATKPLRLKKAEKFLEGLEKRLEKARKRIEASKMPEHVKAKVLKKLDMLAKKLEEIRRRLSEGELGKASREMEEAEGQITLSRPLSILIKGRSYI